jgi:hypothetical protein
VRILKLWGPVAVWAGLILFAATDLFSAESSGSLLQMIFGVEVPRWLHVALRKLAHLVVYGILAGLTWRADRRWAVILAIVVGIAAVDEAMQSRSVHRTGSVVDVGIDVVGACLALAAIKSQSRRVAKSKSLKVAESQSRKVAKRSRPRSLRL